MIFMPPKFRSFYAPEASPGGILKSHCPSVRLSVSPSVSYKSCLSLNSNATEANFTKLHRKIKYNKKVCRVHDLGSCTQGQGHSGVRGQICVSAITLKLLKQTAWNFIERSSKMRRCVVYMI